MDIYTKITLGLLCAALVASPLLLTNWLDFKVPYVALWFIALSLINYVAFPWIMLWLK